ncbi:hypothetical protein GCM10009839_23060 [Catenulispora yoronensis]|uniref:Uncharacterized protein n=1 Tax=Catenulispora yoronensis TaxID=450799 RepID=A0ABN2TZL8_9ACTN
MEWMFIEAYCAMFYGSSRSTKTELNPGGESAPTEIDLWLTRQTYEFATAHDTCTKCGAGFRRKVSLAAVFDVRDESVAPWRIGVDTRCRGWRRHRHSASVTESRGGLRFEPLRPG